MTTPGAATQWLATFHLPPRSLRLHVQTCVHYRNRPAHIDYFLQPLASDHKTFIKNTPHFIDIATKCRVTGNTIIGTSDMDGMYTNIGHIFMLEAVKNKLSKNPPTPENPRIPDKHLLKLLEICLTRNDFYFNNQYYLQIKGTAMGKRFAPSGANIFMAEWEEQVLLKVMYKPDIWFRYLDDIYFLWDHGKERPGGILQDTQQGPSLCWTQV